MFDLGPPSKIWTPPKPAIIRAASLRDIEPIGKAVLPGITPFINRAPVHVLIDRTAGSTIGNMTGGGGLASGFDGNTAQASGSGPVDTSAALADQTIGKYWGSGVTHTVSKAIAYATTNLDFYNGGTSQLLVQESSDGSSWTTIYTGPSQTYSNSEAFEMVTSGATPKSYHRVVFKANGVNASRCSEIQFYEFF